MLKGAWIIMGMVILYMVFTTLIGIRSMKHSTSTSKTLQAKGMMGVTLIGFLMMSEFLGTASSVGTAQTAFKSGIWAGWNVLTLAIGYLLYAFFMAPKYQASGEYTISGVLNQTYGKGTKLVTSVVMLFSMCMLNITLYVGGGAAISTILGIPIQASIVVLALICASVVAMGGIRGVGYSNIIHASMKILGLLVAAVVGYCLMRESNLSLNMLPPDFWKPETLGWSKIIAWPIANIGAIFSTQYVIQCISSLKSPAEAKKASMIASVAIVPVAILATFVGLAAKMLFPEIDSVNALPVFIAHANPWVAWLIACCILASTFVSMLAATLGATALFIKDFVLPYIKPDEQKGLVWTRCTAATIALVAIPFALFVPDILKVVFLTRATRLTLAVVAIFAFYSPLFSTKKGAMWSIILAAAATIFWFAMVNSGPMGNIAVGSIILKDIDNIFIAGGVPLLVLIVDHFFFKPKGKEAQALT